MMIEMSYVSSLKISITSRCHEFIEEFRETVLYMLRSIIVISNNASGWAGGMAKLVHHFGPAYSISTTTEWVSITFCTDIHDTQRAYFNDCGDVSKLMVRKDRIINRIIYNYMANM